MARKESRKSHAEIASDIAAWLAKGNVIEEVDYTANKGWRQHISRAKHPWIMPRVNTG